MKTKRLNIFLGVLLLMVVVGCAPATPLVVDPAGDPITCETAQGEAITIAASKLIIEYHFTAGDMGVHGLFDDHGWSELCVYDPNGVQVLAVKPQSQLKDLSIAGIFFESREPPLDEFTYEDLKAKYPEGNYEVRGRNFDGTWLTGFATFTHDVPAAPTVTSPTLAEEESAGDVVAPMNGLVVQWQDVSVSIEGKPVSITGYEIIVTKVEHDDPHGFSQPIFDVHVPADRNSLSVPVEFLEPGTVYELEVLVLEASGNQTITSGFFTTEAQ